MERVDGPVVNVEAYRAHTTDEANDVADPEVAARFEQAASLLFDQAITGGWHDVSAPTFLEVLVAAFARAHPKVARPDFQLPVDLGTMSMDEYIAHRNAVPAP